MLFKRRIGERICSSRFLYTKLDYTKIVILTNIDYIDNVNAIIDKDEFKQTMIHFSPLPYFHKELGIE